MTRLKRQTSARLLAAPAMLALALVICLSGLAGTTWAATTTSILAESHATQTVVQPATQPTTAPTSTVQSSVSPPVIHAKSAIVIDLTTGEILYSHDANARRPMASITKIMTAILALETLPPDREVTVSARAAKVGEQSLGLKAGDHLTVDSFSTGLSCTAATTPPLPWQRRPAAAWRPSWAR